MYHKVYYISLSRYVRIYIHMWTFCKLMTGLGFQKIESKPFRHQLQQRSARNGIVKQSCSWISCSLCR